MKKISLIAILFFSICANGQNFEGKVVYQNTYLSKIPGVSSQTLASEMGTRQDYYIRGGSYRSIGNGVSQLGVYINSENRLYMKFQGNDTLLWIDAGTNHNAIIKSEVNKVAFEILGYKCDEVIFTTKNGVEKYYFNSKLGVDASLYTKHSLGNWYELVKITRSLPLKSIVETPQYTITSVATEVVQMTLNQKDFELPKDAKIEKSPY